MYDSTDAKVGKRRFLKGGLMAHGQMFVGLFCVVALY